MKNKNFSIKLRISFICLLTFGFWGSNSYSKAQNNNINDYVIAVNDGLKSDKEWMDVVEILKEKHTSSQVLFYKKSLEELISPLKRLQPRYLCVVDKPENINRDFVVEGNRMCRTMDNDIYDDYIWGIITGYSASDAQRTAKQSAHPYTIKTALSSTSEVKSGIWFDKFAWLDDGSEGVWGEKKSPNDSIHTYKTDHSFNLLPIFKQKWEEIDPDIIITSSHATQKNLEMPFSSGNIKAKDGKLYAAFSTPEFMPSTSKPRIYFPVGNCLIGDIDCSKQSMATAWLSSGGATAMLAYVVSTWYGRNGWGALKFFVTAPSKLTLAEAAFLNRQDMLTQEYKKDPKLLDIEADFKSFGEKQARKAIEYHLRKKNNSTNVNRDEVGYIYDRDVVVYYGDPTWNVRLQNVESLDGYEFAFETTKDNKAIITLKTKSNFDMQKAVGKGFKEEHVKDIPIGYFFPSRLFSPKLVSNKQNLDIVFDENFMLIYNKNIEPNKEYQLIFETKKIK